MGVIHYRGNSTGRNVILFPKIAILISFPQMTHKYLGNGDLNSFKSVFSGRETSIKTHKNN